MIFAMNYADKVFAHQQKYNSRTAISAGGADKVFSYTPEDIEHDFAEKNKKILSFKRGGGYWLWKPYFVAKTLELLNVGDYLFYCDSGAYYVNKILHLVNFAKSKDLDILCFELPYCEYQYTRNSAFQIMGCDSDFFRNSRQILATCFLAKNSEFTKRFFADFVKYAQNPDVILDVESKDEEDERFIENRHDQTIFSLLCKKNGIKPFRDPSQYGDFYQRDFIKSPNSDKIDYSSSTYPRIIISTRRTTHFHFIEFRMRIFVEDTINKLPLRFETPARRVIHIIAVPLKIAYRLLRSVRRGLRKMINFVR